MGAPLARYWVHNGFVDMGAEKMSKSLGNIVTPAELLEQGHKGETLRLALLSAHYRQPLPWTESLIAQSKAVLDRWYRVLGDVEPAIGIDRALRRGAERRPQHAAAPLSRLRQRSTRSMSSSKAAARDPIAAACWACST